MDTKGNPQSHPSVVEALAFGTALFDLTGPLTVLADYRRRKRQQATAKGRR